MNMSIAEVIEVLIAAALRRKRLIIVPILLFSALAGLAVVAWPRMYAAHALLMLQERGSSDPLSLEGGGASRQGRLKAEEIDMLLKSERVLTGAIIDMNLGKKPLSARDIEGEIKSLKKHIGVSVVGNDFIEIELKETDRVGIGERLSIIMTRFFERLLTREDSIKTAREFALEQRQRDVAAASTAIEDWMQRAKIAGAKDGLQDAKLQTLRANRTELETKITTAVNTLMLGAAGFDTLDQVLDEEIRIAASRIQSSGPLAGLSQRLDGLRDLKSKLDAHRALGLETSAVMIGNARTMAQSLRAATPQTGAQAGDQSEKRIALEREMASLDARYAEALDQYDKHVKRAKKGSGPSITPFGLIAPDSIRIIDEPRDPALPTTSLLKILVACLGAGVGLGIGLAALAEQLDDRIYDSRGLDTLTGTAAMFRVPLIATDAETDAEPSKGTVDEKSTRRARFAVVSRA